MVKFFIIVWFSVTLPNQPMSVDYLVNTSLQFNTQQDCQIFVGFEYMPLTIGVSDYLDDLYQDSPHAIKEIGCVGANKLKILNKTKVPQ